jgi:hypothetical protein
MDDQKELYELIEYKYRCMRKCLRALQLFVSQHKQSFPVTPSEYNKQKYNQVESDD